MRIDSGGRLGLGTTAPTFALQVALADATSTKSMGLTENSYTTNFRANYLTLYGLTATGTSFGLSNANLGILTFQNLSAGLIGTNGAAPLVFATTSLERMRIDASGNVGIGTTAPSSLLTVDGGLITTINYASTPQIRFNYAAGTKASPTAIASQVPVGAVYGFGYDGTVFQNTSGILMYSDAAVSSNSSPGFILFTTTPSGSTTAIERMRIDSAGNVGIGAVTPNRTGTTTATNTILEVNGSITLPYTITGAEPLRIGAFTNTNFVPGANSVGNAVGFTVSNWNTLSDGSGSTYLQAGVDSGNGGIQLQARKTGAGVVSRLADFSISTSQFFTNNTEHMRIDSSGNVGIGTTSPSVKLDVVGSGIFTGGGDILTMKYSSDAGSARFAWKNVAGTTLWDIVGGMVNRQDELAIRRAGTSVIYLDNANNVGIGNTTPSTKLDVAGVASAVFFENPQTITSNYTITINSNAMAAGPITIASGVTVTIPSGSVWTVV
jgi:hypothetical protein